MRTWPAVLWGSRWLPFASVLTGAGAIFFLHLGRYGLWEADEPRYAEIAREMIAGGNYLIPHLNYVPYVEKPPLLYWLTSLCMWLLGPTQLAARLVPAASALTGVALTFWFVERVFDRRRAVLAAAILATSPLYAVLAQVLLTDMLLTALLTAAFFMFFAIWRDGGRLWPWLYIAIALAVLTKGPIGCLLPGVAALLFLLIKDRRVFRSTLRRLHPVAGAAIVLVIAAPWFVFMTWRLPGYFEFYFVAEHVRRFFVASYSHGEPVYFYLPVLLGGLLPWTPCLPLLWKYGSKGAPRLWCALVAGVVLTVFSLADAKLFPYILPAFPPLAVLLADSIANALDTISASSPDECGWNRAARWMLCAPAAILAVGGAGLAGFVLAVRHITNPYLTLLKPSLLAVAAVIGIGGLAALAAASRRNFGAGLILAVLTTTVGLMTATWCRIAAEPIRPYSALSRAVSGDASAGPLICYHRYVQSLPFYTHRRTVMVGRALSELRFGADHIPDRDRYFLPDDNALIALWRRAPHAILVIDAPELARLRPRLGPIRVLASEGSKRAITSAVPRKERD